MVVALEKYATLKQWFIDNKCGIHPYIEIKPSPLGGVGVFATKPLIGNTPLLSVPKEYILCPTTCGIANLLEDYELTGMMGLTVAFMFEMNLGEKSPWWGYLNTIDTSPTIESLPRFWTKEQQELLKGTEIVTMGGLDEEEIKQTFNVFVLPFFKQNFALLGYESEAAIPTYEDYRNSLVAVSSRAFEVDAYRGLALVPGACLFNHSDSEHVHFETNEDVCDLCGADDGCEHDMERIRLDEGELFEDENNDDEEEEEEGSELVEPDTEDEDSDEEEEDEEENEWEDDDEDMLEDEDADDFDSEDDEDEDDEEEKDACDIVVSVPRISTGAEIFNTYGEENNGLLLSRYGFAMLDNQHESISLVEQVINYVEKNKLQSRLKWWKNSGVKQVLKENFSDDGHGHEHDPEDGCCGDDSDHDHDHSHGHGHEEHEHDPEGGCCGGDDHDHEMGEEELDEMWSHSVELDFRGAPSVFLMGFFITLSLDETKFQKLVESIENGEESSETESLFPQPTKQTLAVLKQLIDERYTAYEDGNLSSNDYKKLISKLTKNSKGKTRKLTNEDDARKNLAFICKSSEKAVLERCLEWINKTKKSLK